MDQEQRTLFYRIDSAFSVSRGEYSKPERTFSGRHEPMVKQTPSFAWYRIRWLNGRLEGVVL
jgi:hypothetical protein